MQETHKRLVALVAARRLAEVVIRDRVVSAWRHPGHADVTPRPGAVRGRMRSPSVGIDEPVRGPRGSTLKIESSWAKGDGGSVSARWTPAAPTWVSNGLLASTILPGEDRLPHRSAPETGLAGEAGASRWPT